MYRDEAEIEFKGYYYEFTEGDRAVFAGIDKTNGTYDILMKSANNLGDTINDYRNYIDTDGRWYFQNGTNVPQKYLLEGEVAGEGSGTAYTLEEPLYFIGNEINIRQAGTSQNGFLTSTDWTTFNDKLSDGDTVNDFLNFADNKNIYFGYTSPSSFGARICHSDIDSTVFFGTSNSHMDIYVYGVGKNITLSSSQGYIKFASNKYLFNSIEIDFTNFATGKVLTATSSTKAEWVTP